MLDRRTPIAGRLTPSLDTNLLLGSSSRRRFVLNMEIRRRGLLVFADPWFMPEISEDEGVPSEQSFPPETFPFFRLWYGLGLLFSFSEPVSRLA
jgi:hypothetical protein